MAKKAPIRSVPALVLALALLAPAVPGCGRLPWVGSPAVAGNLSGLELDGGLLVGEPLVAENLAVFPLYARAPEDPGEFLTLPEALEQGRAEVREAGSGAEETAPAESEGRGGPSGGNTEEGSIPSFETMAEITQQQVGDGGGARVETLVIVNKSDKPILVLSGTLVHGGNQDREIGQDFVVAAATTVPVDVFCVEHGRWSEVREGKETQGTFKAGPLLGTLKPRAEGTYGGNQEAVWDAVQQQNVAIAGGTAPVAGETLMFTMENEKVKARRGELVAAVKQGLDRLEWGESVVGLAYAVGGKIHGARWFAGRRLFLAHRDTLLNTAAVEAITAQQEAAREKKEFPVAEVRPAAMRDFIQAVDREGRREEKKNRRPQCQ